MDEAILQAIGARIRELRKQRGLSQEQLGELAGVHFSYIGAIERGKKNVTVLNLKKIADVLQVSVYNLLLYSDNLKINRSEKDTLLNQTHEKLAQLSSSDLRKVLRFLSDYF